MAKKKKRSKKRKKRHYINLSARDTHHLCFQRKQWQRGNLRLLKDFWYCKICIKRDTLHRYIHENISNITPPKDTSAKYALEQLELLEKYEAISEYDSIERRLNILASLFDSCDQATADDFRTQLRIICEFKKPPK